MKRSYSSNSFSRFIPILLVVIITVVAVAAVIAIGQALFGSGRDGEQQESRVEIDEGRTSLLSSDLSRSVRLTVRGPIVADEKFRSYRITVAPDSRDMTTYEGYLEKQLEAKNLDNNTKAYEEFVYALDKRGMMNSRKAAAGQDDLRGICATGKVYQFETLMSGEPVKSLWTSDCDGSKGSAQANVQEILDMFLKQVPDGGKMASGVGLSQQDTFFRL